MNFSVRVCLALAAVSSLCAQGADRLSFVPRVDFAADGIQATLAVGDLDGDGKPDVVVGNYHNSSLSIYRNTSTHGVVDASSFASRVNFIVGKVPHHVVLGDVDGDGKRDIVCINQGSAELSVLRNTATAGVIDRDSFAEVVFKIARDPRAAALQDFNGDGKPDVVVACFSTGTLFLLENESTPGMIAFGPRRILSANASAGTLTAGDLDGDGKPEIVVPSAKSPVLWIYRNTGAGGELTAASFERPITIENHVADVTLGDADGDGKVDLVGVHESANTLCVWRNVGSPGRLGLDSFAPRVDFPTGAYPYWPVVANVDGDGHPDIVLANAAAHTIAVFRNLSKRGEFTSASLAPRVDFPTGKGPRALAVVDIDGDGLAEVVHANLDQPSFSILRQGEPPTPGACELNPLISTNVVGSVHGIIARVKVDGLTVIGATVNFAVTSGPNAGASGSIKTRANRGSAHGTFNYTGEGGAGTDVIQASGVANGAPFSCVATQVWIAR
jgi:hypothetical protein